jgi:hypothetical protein
MVPRGEGIVSEQQPPWEPLGQQDPRQGQGQYPPQQPYGYQPPNGQPPSFTPAPQYGPQPGDPVRLEYTNVL